MVPACRSLSDDVLPSRTKVVIVGGGMVGASTALFLAQKGIKSVVCEKRESRR
jgi:glycine/D-amino acid oxidase-like deaminating enzyme